METPSLWLSRFRLSITERLLYLAFSMILLVVGGLIAAIVISHNQNTQQKDLLNQAITKLNNQATKIENLSQDNKNLSQQNKTISEQNQTQQTCLFNLFVSFINEHTAVTKADVASCQVLSLTSSSQPQTNNVTTRNSSAVGTPQGAGSGSSGQSQPPPQSLPPPPNPPPNPSPGPIKQTTGFVKDLVDGTNKDVARFANAVIGLIP